ncbi:MAG: NAD-dependent epimerase/dehydratase family protein [Ignavibacteria bacterium]|nr:NAD-dependent epimerase/dehydratase family protein [Ignavibacteria bacterium]
MVGEGVLHECLLHPAVGNVLIINRKSLGLSHPKLKEIIIKSFDDLSSIEGQISGYDACFFCLGMSSVGISKDEYYRITYELTLNFATTLSGINTEMTFCYISGAGTDSSESGRISWARVKGKTENALFRLPFKKVFAVRPGFLYPTHGLKNTKKFYYLITWLYPAMRHIFPNFVSTLPELGLAILNSVIKGYEKSILEVKDIVDLAKR